MLKLLSYIGAAFTTLIPALIAFFARKYTVAAACLVAFVAATATLIVCIKAFVTTIVTFLTIPVWLGSIAWFVPPHFLALFSIIVSGRTCRAAYDITIEKIKMISAAS
jgi:hypothetical protein